MKISEKLIPYVSDNYWGFTNNALSHETTILLVIISLHIQKLINDDKLKAMLKSLKAGTLLRKVNTYNCKINGKWYNDELMYLILLDVYNELCKREDISLDDLLKYLNLYLNRNKNFCIDWIYFDIIEPLIQVNDSRSLETFGVEGLDIGLSFEEADRLYGLGEGYCCEDCDGCYKEYKKSRYRQYYKKDNKEKTEKLFKEYLFNQKTPSALKNPFEKLRG